MVLDGLHERAHQYQWEVAFYHLGKVVAIRESLQHREGANFTPAVK